MRLYRSIKGPVLEFENTLYLLNNDNWDDFILQDDLYAYLLHTIDSTSVLSELPTLLTPIESQELWACGVTYLRSKQGRQEESQSSGGADFYARVYEAERPEIFFKGTKLRIVGPNEPVRIRKDSTWNVPEPELTLVVNPKGKIIAYTIGNDMSSRSIEGENPLYLPQAKTYDGSAALGPCLFVSPKPIERTESIHLKIERGDTTLFEDSVPLTQMKRDLNELVSYAYRECSFPLGCYLMTGTGIVPPSEITLQAGDRIEIHISPIGTLVNTVA